VAAIAAALALAVAASAATRAWRRGEAIPGWLGPAVVAAGSTMLTLYRPGITPDHPWADRRLVPVVLPAVVIAATAAAIAAIRWARRSCPATLLAAIGVTAVLAVVGPAAVATWPVAGQRTERGEVAAVRAVCAALRPGDVVIAVDTRARNEWPQVVRGVCDHPAARLTVPAEDVEAALARVAGRVATAGGRPVLLAAGTPGGPGGGTALAASGLRPRQVAALDTIEDQRLLERRPDGADPLRIEVWLADWPG
jgi:hypothetical protein